MKMQLKKNIIGLLGALSIFLGLNPSAKAGFLIEPFIDYAMSGDYEQGSNSFDLSTTMFGARAGFSTLGLIYGLEYATGSYSIETPIGDVDGDTTDIGAFIGYEFPIMLRVWLSYYIDSKAKAEGASGDSKGTGTKIGVSYTGLPFVALNFQMLNRSYDEASDGSEINPEVKFSTFLLGLSLPLP